MLDKQSLIEGADRIAQRLFGLKPGWHKELDLVKNNYGLARSYIARGNYREAMLRLRFLTWIDPGHKPGLLDLARAYIALDKRQAAKETLDRLLKLDSAHEEAKKLKAALAKGKVVITPALEITPEMDARPLYQVHKEAFPVYWKESEIAEMLLTSGTQAWLARMGQPVGMLMTRAQFEQAEILTIAVVPAARRSGIASRLMAEAEKTLAGQGVRKIFLEVAENNGFAVALYTRLGYEEVSRRRDYYKQSDNSYVDALVMGKELG